MPRHWKKPESPQVQASAAPDPEEIYRRALGLLARREHSRLELQRKLMSRGIGLEVLAPVLDRLAAEKLQSDARFAEQYVHQRQVRGFGPLRIRAELNERGIDSATLEHALEDIGVSWGTLAVTVRHKRFGCQPPEDIKARLRQTRFLQQRGFQSDHIREALNANTKPENTLGEVQDRY